MTQARHRFRFGTSPLLFWLGLAWLAAGGLLAQPVAEPTLTVTGTLVDERGAPAAGVEVVLRPYPSAYDLDLDLLGEANALPEPADRARTRPDGAFSLSAPAIGPYRLEIRPSPPTDTAPVTVPFVYRDILPLRVPLHLEPIELPARHPLTVRALDPNGQPIAGAFVVVEAIPEQPKNPPYREAHEQPERLHPEFDRASMLTGAEGLARFLMPASKARVAVAAAGFARRVGTATGDRAAFRLSPAPSVALRVRGPDGQPAGGALVRTPSEPPIPLALTDEHGETTIGITSDGQAIFRVETAGGAFARALARAQPTRGGAPEASIIEVQLQPPVALPGRVADAETEFAVPNAVVWLNSDPGRRTVADGSGGFDLDAPLPRGGLELGVAAAGYSAAKAKVTGSRFQSPNEVSIGLVPAAPLIGWVVDAFDHPVGGANVYVEPRGRGQIETAIWGLSGRATSGPDGSFWIANAIYGGRYRLTVEAPAFAAVQRDLPVLERSALADPVRVVLTRGRQPWGTVVNPDGTPVTGAQVRLLWPPDDPVAGHADGNRDAAEPVYSNDRGEFEFPTVAPGPYGLAISHPEHLDLTGKIAGVPQGEGYTDLGIFTLTPGAEIHGVVVESSRRPVPGAEVRASQRGQGLAGHNRTTTTNQNGRFRLSGLLPVLADLTAVADGYIGSVVRSVRPATGESIVIELAKGASLAGRVLDTDGTAAADLNVRLSLPMDEQIRTGTSLLWRSLFKLGRTDADGRFRFDDLTPARWTATANNEESGATENGIELTAGELREIELRLQALDQLTLHVTNHLGEPVVNALVVLSPQGRGQQRAQGLTDSGGRVDLWISPGPATARVEHPNLLSRSRDVELEPGDNELHVQLDPGWEISGTVRSASGFPIEGTVVEAGKPLPRNSGTDASGGLTLSRYGLERTLNPPSRSVSAADGSFRLTRLDRGRYFLIARLPGYTERESAEEVEINGQSVAGVEIVLVPEASILGTVTGLPSSEIPTAEILAWSDTSFRGATPDSEGGFELKSLAPGTWRLIASAGDRRSVAQSLTLKPGATGASVELRFEPGFRLSGQVLIAGEPASGGFVTAVLNKRLGPKNRLRIRTDHQGRFDMEGLPPGTYELEFGHREATRQEQTLDLRSDHYDLLVNLQPRPAQPN